MGPSKIYWVPPSMNFTFKWFMYAFGYVFPGCICVFILFFFRFFYQCLLYCSWDMNSTSRQMNSVLWLWTVIGNYFLLFLVFNKISGIQTHLNACHLGFLLFNFCLTYGCKCENVHYATLCNTKLFLFFFLIAHAATR